MNESCSKSEKTLEENCSEDTEDSVDEETTTQQPDQPQPAQEQIDADSTPPQNTDEENKELMLWKLLKTIGKKKTIVIPILLIGIIITAGFIVTQKPKDIQATTITHDRVFIITINNTVDTEVACSLNFNHIRYLGPPDPVIIPAGETRTITVLEQNLKAIFNKYEVTLIAFNPSDQFPLQLTINNVTKSVSFQILKNTSTEYLRLECTSVA